MAAPSRGFDDTGRPGFASIRIGSKPQAEVAPICGADRDNAAIGARAQQLIIIAAGDVCRNSVFSVNKIRKLAHDFFVRGDSNLFDERGNTHGKSSRHEDEGPRQGEASGAQAGRDEGQGSGEGSG